MSGNPPNSQADRWAAILKDRSIEHVVVLGANGTMGYGSAALFTTAVPKVTLLARTRDKAEEGLAAAIKQVRSPTVASRTEVGDYDTDLERVVGEADLVFEALTEDLEIKRTIFDRVEKARRDDSIVATVTSGLSINQLCEGRSESFRKHFMGLHFFNPPNVIVGTELIPGNDTDPQLVDFIEAFSTLRLGRVMVRTADTPAFAGNRVGFKVLNEAAQLAEQMSPTLVDRLVGPYTGRAMTPLATIDLVGWDIHRAIVDNVYENSKDEAHSTLKLPDYMDKLMASGVMGNKSGGGFFKKAGDDRLVLDPSTGQYVSAADIKLPNLDYIGEVAHLYSMGRYAEGMAKFLAAEGDEAALARKVIAGYVAYAFERAGEVTETITGIDMIMGAGFNWAPPSVLVDTMGAQAAVSMIEEAELSVPSLLSEAAGSKEGELLFNDDSVNIGKFFVAS